MAPFTFIHSGRMGDVLYSLYAATHLTAQLPNSDTFDYVLRTGVSAWDPSGRPHMMEQADAEFLKPLLEAQPYIHEVRITSGRAECYVLDSFRRNMSLVIGREIRSWYFDPREPMDQDEFARPVLTLPDAPEKKPWIAVCFTPRYRQKFDLSPLFPYRDRILFAGLPAEHCAFCRDVFPVEYHPVENALELLSFMASCAGFVGNVSGTFAVAECAKIPRILCLAPDGGNVKPQGGFHRESRSSDSLEIHLKQLLEEQPS